MIALLQEILQYIESEQKFLQELQVVTEASRERYLNIHEKILKEIENTLALVKSELVVKQEPFYKDDKEDIQNEDKDSDFHVEESSDESSDEQTSTKKVMNVKPDYVLPHENRTNKTTSNKKRQYIPKRHIRKECNVCKKKFNHLGSFKLHMRSHTGEKPFQCDVCGKHFSQMGNLKRHKKVHTGERPFKCPKCPARFAEKQKRENHFLIHTGEKPFECSTCTRRFREMATLRQHIRTHTKEKPFICEICKRPFAQAAALRKHKLLHNG